MSGEDNLQRVKTLDDAWNAQGLDGKMHPPTGNTFELEFCPVARWKNGEIVEEKLFYDQVSFLRQFGGLKNPLAIRHANTSAHLITKPSLDVFDF
jgi:hypothetical protein